MDLADSDLDSADVLTLVSVDISSTVSSSGIFRKISSVVASVEVFGGLTPDINRNTVSNPLKSSISFSIFVKALIYNNIPNVQCILLSSKYIICLHVGVGVSFGDGSLWNTDLG